MNQFIFYKYVTTNASNFLENISNGLTLKLQWTKVFTQAQIHLTTL